MSVIDFTKRRNASTPPSTPKPKLHKLRKHTGVGIMTVSDDRRICMTFCDGNKFETFLLESRNPNDPS